MAIFTFGYFHYFYIEYRGNGYRKSLVASGSAPKNPGENMVINTSFRTSRLKNKAEIKKNVKMKTPMMMSNTLI